MPPTGAVCLVALFFVKTTLLLTNNIEFDIIKALFEWRKADGAKKGAGGKPQKYDNNSGKYVSEYKNLETQEL
mgnify:CR=1 FL=1